MPGRHAGAARRQAGRRDLGQLATCLAERGCVGVLAAGRLHQMASFASRRRPARGCEIVIAGEACTRRPRRAGSRRSADRLFNQYGPTEATGQAHALARPRPLPTGGAPCRSAGRSPTRGVYVLDDRLQPVPVGVPGELYIGGDRRGPGLPGPAGADRRAVRARPVRRRPGAADVPHRRPGPLARRRRRSSSWAAPTTRSRSAASGSSWARWRRCCGRTRACARRPCWSREDAPASGTWSRYVVRRPARRRPGELRAHARGAAARAHGARPRSCALDALPLTANGKLDRRALPAPEPVGADRPTVAPRTADRGRAGRHLGRGAAAWSGSASHDDFFALGGHSLLATRLVHAINQRMSAATVAARPCSATRYWPTWPPSWTGPTPTRRPHRFDQLVPDPAGRHQPFPLTDIQQAYWVGRDSTIELGGVGAHGYSELRMPDFDQQRFSRALNRLIVRHDMLRAVFDPTAASGPCRRCRSTGCRARTCAALGPPSWPSSDWPSSGSRCRTGSRAGRWPLFEFAVTLLDDEVRLHAASTA